MTRLWFPSALLPGGWADAVRVTLAGRAIASVEVGVAPDADDERHGPAVPGLPNVHSHTFQRAMAGAAERAGGGDTFWTWRDAMYRVANALTADDIEAVAALAFAEMLEAGFTRAGEFHYLHHDPDGRRYVDPAETGVRVLAATAATGIGLTLLPAFYAHAGFGGTPPTPGQRRFVTDVDGFAELLDATRRAAASVPGTVVGVAPHSLRAVTPDELARVVPATGPVHIHVAEQTREVDECVAWCGRRPVEFLLDHADVNDRWCLIHATHATPAELSEVVKRGAVVGLCPVTEANLGDGVFDARAFAGGRYAVGSDSNVRIDAADELRTLEYGQRLATRTRNVLATAAFASTGRALFEAARVGGCQALGVPSGGIAAGATADLVSFDAGHPTTAGRVGDGLLDAWVFAGGRESIADVWAGGRHTVRDGRHVQRDAIAGRFRQVVSRYAQG